MPTSGDLPDYQWLLSPAAREMVQATAESDLPLHQLAARLRKEHSPERTALLLDQRELRQRAREKFDHAADMWFTRVALEQATDQWTAAYKAERFAKYPTACDVCTGIGGDLLALAAATQATGIDASEVAVLLAKANLIASDRQAEVTLGEAAPAFVAQFDAWHADPDRRSTGRRTSSVELHSPDLATLEAMLQENPNAAIKLAPAGAAPDEWQQRAELEWISRDRECRQQVAWFGDLAHHPGKRSATRLDKQGNVLGNFTGHPDAPLLMGERIGEWLYEPDPAVLAADLHGALAKSLDLAAAGTKVAYFTSQHDVKHPLLTRFRVVDQLPSAQVKAVAAYLRERNVGRLEIKHRGLKLDPELFRKQLKLRGDNEAVVIVFPLRGKPIAVIAEREDSEPPVR